MRASTPLRGRWATLLLSRRDFQRQLAKERIRTDRTEIPLGIISVKVEESKNLSKHLRLLVRILHRRLRQTDEKGFLGHQEIGVLLPATDRFGATVVASDIEQKSQQAGIPITLTITMYPAQDLPPRSKSEQRSIGDSSDHGTRREAANERAEAIAALEPTAISSIVSGYPSWKRGMDVVGSMTGLLLSSPVLLVAMVAIKATSAGPIFFRQMRTGQHGQPFAMYKLRTMVVGAEQQQDNLRKLNERDGPAFKLKQDPRITPVGRILRATGIDELPQLWNVLRGDMALVGPRPLPCSEQAECESWQSRRLDTRPGLTCYWQVSKSRSISFAEWMRLDLKYADSVSIFRDLGLILRTLAVIVRGKAGH